MHARQIVEAFGIPYVEYGYDEPEVEQLICIEFTPPAHHLDDYAIPVPAFTFCEEVAVREQYDHCLKNNIDFSEGLDVFRISALELVERRSKSGVLTDAPHWLYGIRYARGTRELIWFEEDELARPLPPEVGEF
jgi:hypothetical protein